jgi:hypothetical protein
MLTRCPSGTAASGFTVNTENDGINTLWSDILKSLGVSQASFDKSSPREDSTDSKDPRGKLPPKTPSVPGFPPNAEVDAHYVKLRALYLEDLRKGGAPFECFTDKSPFGPATAGISLEELSTVTLPQLLERNQPVPGGKLFLKVVEAAYMVKSVQALVEDENSGHHVRISVYNTTTKSQQV